MAISKITTKGIADDSVTSAKLAPGAVTANDIPDSEIPFSKLSQVNLDIAPEVLEIQVAAPAAGQATTWLWTWEQSTLPYARRTITNSPEVNVPLYKQGTYTVNNYAAYDLFGDMTQTHTLYFKWIDGAGTDNLISWAVSTGPVSDTHPNINGGAATDVQRINITVPATVTPPTLTAPNVSYSVVNNGAGAYTFSGSAKGDNPNIGPMYRGGTYTFNVNAVGHPFYFTTDNGTNFSAGTYFGEYTSGVTGSRTDNGTVTIVVPNDAPGTLYYQCGNHGVMRGAITIRDLAVEVNNNGNYIVYAQHTQEGHKTPVELRPIPSLVNQMCLVYDATSGKFVPQDLATYVENTPSFENKIREVAGTAELVVEDGSAVIAKVNVYDDSTYLPLVGNNPGDQAFATDTDILYIWDGSAWQQAGAANTDDLAEGTTNLFYTDARVGSYLSSNGYDTATNIVASITDSAPATLDTLNELAAALGDDPNFATTTATNIAGKVAKTGDTMSGALTVGNTGGGANRGVGIDPNGEITQNATDGSWLHLNRYIDGLVAIGHNSTANFYAKNNVGIGTDIPQAKLHVNTTRTSSTNATSFILSDNVTGIQTDGVYKSIRSTSNNGSSISEIRFIETDGTNNNTAIAFATQSTAGGLTERLRVHRDGNVGIGTASPIGKLEVNAGTGNTFRAIRYEDHLMEIGNYNASDGYRATLYGSSEHRFITATAGAGSGTVDMTITDGNVGIGTATPYQKLTVNTPQRSDGGTNSLGAAVIAGPISVPDHDFTNSTAIFRVQGTDATNNIQFGVGDGSYSYHGWIQASFDNTNSNGSKDLLLQPIGGDVGIGTINPASLLHIKSTDNGSSDHSAYGHPVTGGQNGAFYIDKSNSRFDWDDGLVFCGEGTTWSARFTGRNGLTTNSDTSGEILSVHPVEGSGTTWNDTAGASPVTSAFLRVMGNGKTFVKKLNSEDAFVAPNHATDAAANSAGGNVAGSIYYNTASGVHRSYNGSFWSNIGNAPITESTFDAFGDGSALCLLKANNSNLDTGGTHNASLVNATYTTTSKFGSHSFNTVGNGTYFDIASLPMVETVSFWYHCVGSSRGYLVDFRHDNPNNGRSYLYTHDGASGGTGQNINMGNDTTTTNRTGIIYINGVQFSSGAYQFYDSTWYHICIVRDATDTHRTWDQGLRFGNRSDGTTEGNAGYFDQIRVFNRRLSAAEALTLFNEIA